MSLAVGLWSEEQFTAGRETWQTLLARSDADPLFMGWDWQWTWWQHHRYLPGATLHVVAVMDADRLVALMPLYLRNMRLRGVLGVRRLECLGTAWRENDAVFSEYFDVISDRESVSGVVDALAEWLAAQGWDDWAVSYARSDALVLKVAQRLCDSGIRGRAVEAMPTQGIDLGVGFDVWMARLSSDVRRRLCHQRSRLQQPEFRLVAAADVVAQLKRLQSWRAARYRSDGPGHTVQAFEQALATRLATSGALRLSELRHRGQTLSLMFDARAGDTEYYLASAFAPDVERGLSPGYLHFGYTIEAASNEGVKRFDLLAGHGRHRDYKSDLASEALLLESVHLLRAPLLKFLHRVTGSG